MADSTKLEALYAELLRERNKLLADNAALILERQEAQRSSLELKTILIRIGQVLGIPTKSCFQDSFHTELLALAERVSSEAKETCWACKGAK